MKEHYITGALVIVACLASVALLPAINHFAKEKEEKHRRFATKMNAGELVVAAEWYAYYHGGHLPNSSTWESEIAPYLSKKRTSVGSINRQCFGMSRKRFRMNLNLSGAEVDKIKKKVVLFYEAFDGKDVIYGDPGKEANQASDKTDRVVVGYINGGSDYYKEVPLFDIAGASTPSLGTPRPRKRK